VATSSAKGAVSNSGAVGGYTIAADSTGGFTVGGALSGTADFGKGGVTSAGADDALLAHWDAQNQLQWAKRFGDNAYQQIMSVAVDSKDRILVFGQGAGTINFGGNVLVLQTPSDLFRAKLDLTSAHVSSESWSTGDQEIAWVVARDAWDHQVWVASFSDTLDFGTGPMTPNSGIFYFSNFVVRIDK
jgi:hypothetical protein